MRCINDAHLLSPRGFNNSRRGAAPSVSRPAVSADWLWGLCVGGAGERGRKTCLPATKWQAFVCLFQGRQQEGSKEGGERRRRRSRQESHQLSSTWKLLRVKILETSAGCTCCCCCCCFIEFLSSHTGRDAHTLPSSTCRYTRYVHVCTLVYYESQYFCFMAERCVEHGLWPN